MGGGAEARPGWRDASRAALLAGAMLGTLAVSWTGAAHHKHIRAGYWGWRWATAKESPFSLPSRLREMNAPRSARLLASRIAYRCAGDDRRRTRAAEYVFEYGGLQALYELARAEAESAPSRDARPVFTGWESDAAGDIPEPTAYGGSSPAERVLALCFLEARLEDLLDLEPEGVSDVLCTDYLSEIGEESDATEDHPVEARGTWRLGSYLFTGHSTWQYQIDDEGQSGWVPNSVGPLWLEMHRLPGPWRELPPAPPRPEECADYPPL